jgi:metal-responsive CopG/Arc/MetJ family transcriptional regulator
MKTSVTLPRDLLQEIDNVDPNRSNFLERAARKYLLELARDQRNQRDVLEYQDLG